MTDLSLKYGELYSSQFDYEKEEFEWSDSRLSINLKGKLNQKKLLPLMR